MRRRNFDIRIQIEEMDPSFNLNTNIKVPTPHESTP